MKEINNLKNYFILDDTKKIQLNEKSNIFHNFFSVPQISTPIKYKENHIIKNIPKKEIPAKFLNLNNINTINEQINKDIQTQLEEINKKININLTSIETLKNSLNKLKSEKNEKKSEIVNLLSNRESVDEIYKNYIEYFKRKNRSNKKNKNKNKKEIKNPFENQDEDAFEILIEEIKQIDLIKFIEQSFNLLEEIFDKPTKELKLELKDIINKSYTIFNNEINISNFIDTYSVVSNFFLRISIFLSNQSFGKYSETTINLFLRCLLKINAINVKNEELINYMNGKYKNEKNKLKEEISKLILDNDNLNKNKILLEKKLDKLNNINSTNYRFQTEINKNNENNYLNNMFTINNETRKNNIMKKNIQKRIMNNMKKKLYQEDFEGKNAFEDYYHFTENNPSNKMNYNSNEYYSNTETKSINNLNNFEIEQRYSFKISDKKNDDSNSLKKFNTININDKYKISPIQNFEYTSPKIKEKKQSYYKNIKPNNNINNNNNNNNNINNTGEHGLSKMLSNEKKKNKDNKKGLNFKYNNNKIITYNDIKKNMKFDLAKKIKYLDKVSKNVINTLSKTSIQNKKSIIIYEPELKKKRMYTTEKKEKVVKYNFFDIIQETNKLRNNSGDNNYKAKNKLFDINNINNNFLLRTTKEKKINGKFNISKNIYDINPKKLDSLIKSDFITNKKKSYFSKIEPKNYSQISSSTSKNKTKKNGAEKNESISNEHSDISFQKNKIQNKKNILNGGIINKNKKLEIVGLNKKNIIENKQNNNKNNKLNNKIKIIHKRNIKKGLKKKDIYNIIIDAKNKNSKNNILKNENFNFSEQNSKSNRSEYNNKISYNTNSDNKNKIHNYNTKINKMLLLKKSLSSSMNNLINNKPQKNVIIDSFSDLNNKN